MELYHSQTRRHTITCMINNCVEDKCKSCEGVKILLFSVDDSRHSALPVADPEAVRSNPPPPRF